MYETSVTGSYVIKAVFEKSISALPSLIEIYY